MTAWQCIKAISDAFWDARVDIGSANMPIKPDPLSNPQQESVPIANSSVDVPTASVSQP